MIKKATAIIAIGLLMASAAAPMMMSAAEASATEVTLQDAPSVKVRTGGVTIEIPGDAAQHVVIYALTGQVIKQFDAVPGTNVVDLSAGYYIVRVGHTTVKVAVK